DDPRVGRNPQPCESRGLDRLVPGHVGDGVRLDGFKVEAERKVVVVCPRRPQRDCCGPPHRSSRAIRLDVSHRRPAIFCTSEENWSTRAVTGSCAPLRRASARQIAMSLRIQSTAKPKSNLPSNMVL